MGGHNYNIVPDITSDNHRSSGKGYEEMAAEYLAKKGYVILENNYFCKFGEADIIARTENTIVFVEVKYRRSTSCGNPLEAVTFNKIKKLCRVADFYLACHKLQNVSIRFDVIGILKDDITHLENAFEYIPVK